jgi:WD40 repeat protein
VNFGIISLKRWTSVAAVFAITGLIFLTACEPQPPINTTPVANSAHRMLVLCEGNFMWGNARLDAIDMDTFQLQTDVYKKINDKPLGDVLQSALYWNNSVYLVVNNSGKVVKLNAQSLKQIAANANLGSPRYLLPVGDKLWLTELYANRIAVLDTTNLQKVDEIPVDGWSETLVNWNGLIAVASYRKGVYLFNSNGSAANPPMLAGDSTTRYLAVDVSGRLWIASTGSDGMSTIKRFDNPQNAFPSVTLIPQEAITKMVMSSSGETIYFAMGNKVFQVSVNANSMKEATLVADGFQQLYGLGLSRDGKYLLVADALDYVSNGKVYIIDVQTKIKIKEFETGVNPNGFLAY